MTDWVSYALLWYRNNHFYGWSFWNDWRGNSWSSTHSASAQHDRLFFRSGKPFLPYFGNWQLEYVTMWTNNTGGKPFLSSSLFRGFPARQRLNGISSLCDLWRLLEWGSRSGQWLWIPDERLSPAFPYLGIPQVVVFAKTGKEHMNCYLVRNLLLSDAFFLLLRNRQEK